MRRSPCVLLAVAALLPLWTGCEKSSATGSGGGASNAPPAVKASDTATADRANASAAAQPVVAPPGQASVQPTPAPPPSIAMPPVATATAVTGAGWAMDAPSFDFGAEWSAPGKTVNHSFTFRNVGTEPLKILETKAKCGCTVAKGYTEVVQPGGTGVVPVRLQTVNLKTGPVSKTVDIKTNDPLHATVTLEMKGNIKTLCSMTPPNGAVFGVVQKDQSLYREVIVRSNVDYPLTLTRRPTPPNSFFAVDFVETVPGKEWKLTARAEPPIPEGSQSATLAFNTNSPDVPYYQLHVSCYRKPRVQVVPPKMVINKTDPGPITRNILIINNGTTPVEILSIMTSDPQLNPTLKPADRQFLNRQTIEVILPPGYRPPAWGELIEIKTTDWEKGLIKIVIQPTFANPVARPADKPLTMVPGKI